MAEKGRPGVMFYFDLRPCLKRLSNEEKGQLFESILNYAQFGEVPEPDGMLGVAWDFIKPRIDHDAERYEEVVETKRRAARKRWDKQEEDSQTDAGGNSMQMHAGASGALQAMPTTTTTAKTTTTPSTISTATSTSMPSPSPRSAGRSGPDRRSVAEEMSFEDLRRQKLKMLSGMMGADP